MTMRLNTMKPAAGAKTARKRVGRGHGSGKGGTAGRGTKGQKSRSGGYHKVGFEGGQMPLQRRLPKRGFRSMVNRHTAEVRLNELAVAVAAGVTDGDVVDLPALQQAGVIGLHITRAKVILSGEITQAVTLRGIKATAGARQAIEKAGGTVEEMTEATQRTAKPKRDAASETATETETETKTEAKKETKKTAKKKSEAKPKAKKKTTAKKKTLAKKQTASAEAKA